MDNSNNIDNMDFVYIIKPNDSGSDLIYSLRSIEKYYPNNKVWIAGYKPECITNINFLPIEQTSSKWKNSTNNVIQICKCEDISDDFILMNDDFFAIKPNKPLEDIINSNIGFLDKYIKKYQNHKGEWEKGFKCINDLLTKLKIQKPYYCYEGHLPIKINKKKFLEVINLPEVQEFMNTKNVLFKRTLYKHFDKPKKMISLPIDVKITADRDTSKQLINMCGWLSIADGLINNPDFDNFNSYIETYLSTPCKYEKQDNTRINAMNGPLVSIVSLLYDTKKEYIDKCINSLLKQTYKNIEIIFVDDCSPNMRYDYITKLSPKIKLVRNEENLGFNRNSQKSFDLATGKYIVKIDSDDYVAPNIIEKEVNILENNPNVGAVACELQRFGKNNSYIKRPKEWTIEEALFKDMHGYGYEGGVMFRSELLKEISIDPNYRVCTDFDFNLQILEKMEIKSIHEPLYFYRSHDSNIMISARGGERVDTVNDIIQKHYKIYLTTHEENPDLVPIKLESKPVNKFKY